MAVPVVCTVGSQVAPPPFEPRTGQSVPGRPDWVVVRRLGPDNAGPVWLANHLESGENRVYKFAGDGFVVTGTRAVVDYAAAVLPDLPDGSAFTQGRDPHTVTAYVSPNNGKAYAVMANGYSGPPTYLAVIDIQALLSAPRTTGTHTVDSAYDLLGNHVVAYVPVQ